MLRVLPQEWTQVLGEGYSLPQLWTGPEPGEGAGLQVQREALSGRGAGCPGGTESLGPGQASGQQGGRAQCTWPGQWLETRRTEKKSGKALSARMSSMDLGVLRDFSK